MTYPITDNVNLVTRSDVLAYLQMLFGYIDFAEEHRGCIVLRGIGEKGTDREGKFREPHILPVAGLDLLAITDMVMPHVERWGQYNIASFIVPAVMDVACLQDAKAGDDAVRWFTTICVDIDKGNTTEKLTHATKHIGEPTMVVGSGGITEEGTPKLHVYWQLTEPTDDVAVCGALRKTLALKLGGDTSFQRLPQVIRIPGSVYAKNGVSRKCDIKSYTGVVYDLTDVYQLITDMQPAPGVELKMPEPGGAGLGYFDKAPIAQALVNPIHEGGDDDRNRWSEFNRVAGHYIHSARAGAVTLDEARDKTLGWMAANMIPPWPPQRFDTEWRALLTHDIKTHGPLTQPAPVPATVCPPQEAPRILLSDWRVDLWTAAEKPERKFLVPGWIMAGKHHLFAAEGGAGKTFLLLDLALKVAAHHPGDDLSWCGVKLTDECGGTAVMFTTEDDMDELHIRLSDIDPSGLRFKAGAKLIVVPTINAGGSFPLVERDRMSGLAVPSRAWLGKLEELRAIPNLKLVIIDTLNSTMHGDENSATVINEYVRAATAVCGALGAALIVTHHTRKAGNAPVKNAADMLAATRGSSAISAAFRGVIGIWAASDYRRRMKIMGTDPEPGKLYELAILKANNPQMDRKGRSLLRSDTGLLEDCTTADTGRGAGKLNEELAWLLKAIEVAAAAGHPFKRTAKNIGLYDRKHQLPAILDMGKHRLEGLGQKLLDDGLVVVAGADSALLDVPNGPVACNFSPKSGLEFKPNKTAWSVPDWERVFYYAPPHERVLAYK